MKKPSLLEAESPRINILTTSFPPKGGSGVQRPYYQAKFLGEIGWKLRVFSLDNDDLIEDSSFRAINSSNLLVKRYDSEFFRFNNKRARSIERRLRRKFLFPDEFRLWSKKIVRELNHEIGKREILIASVGSPSTLNILEEARKSSNGNNIVSVVDFTFKAKRTTTVSEVNSILSAAASSDLKDIVQINELPLVSVDFNHNPSSSIFDLTQTKVLGDVVKVLAWYDNEWGFSNRMLDTASAMMRA